MEGGTIGVEGERGGTTRALVVTTPTLNKGATVVDEDATTELAKAAGTLSSAVIRSTS